jgi:hypothetical protein
MSRPMNRPEKPYTRQEILDRIKQHFIIEKNPRCTNKGECVYGLTGCAVGCLMTDEDANRWDNIYRKSDSDITTMSEKSYIYDFYFNKNDIAFLRELQRIHDNLDEFNDLENNLIELTEEYKLNYTRYTI